MSPPRRLLTRVPVPPGAVGPARLLPALIAALDGSGPAIAPIPTVTTTVSNTYVASLLQAARPDDADAPLESDDIAVVICTSGSTGAPRGVLLTAAQLTALTAAVNGPGPAPQWILALPVTSMGGMNVLVRALAADRPPVCLPSIGGAEPFTPAGFVSAVADASRTSADVRVSLVPAQLARLLASDASVEALRACSTILIGGAALRPSVRSMSNELGITVTTTYGGTETAGGCVFNGRPLPGVTVRTPGDDATGLLTVAGPCIASGYRNEPELTRLHFTGGGFAMPDIGTVGPDGLVTVLGRADDVILINGITVSVAAVERVVHDHPDIVSAAVVAVSGAGDSAEPWLCAFVEVRDDAPDVGSIVRACVADLLGPVARPRDVRRVERLPHLPNGKVDRRLLEEWALTGEQTG